MLYVKYRIEGNFGGEKLWRLWRIAQIRQSLIRQLVTILSRAEPVARWKKMSSILNYFKLKPGSKVTSTLKSSDDILKSLPDPDGTLSKSVPSSAIRMANDEVLKLGRNLGMASVTAGYAANY